MSVDCRAMDIIGSKERPINTAPRNKANIARVRARLEELGYTNVQDSQNPQDGFLQDVWGDPPRDRDIPNDLVGYFDVFAIEGREFPEKEAPDSK